MIPQIRNLILAATVALPFSLMATTSSNANELTEERVLELVDQYVRDNPQVLLESINRFVEEERARESQRELQAARNMVDELANSDGVPVVGNPDAETTIVYVIDAACGFCRQMTPVFADLRDNMDDVRIIHRWVPFLGASSEYAGRVAQLMWNRHEPRYDEFYTALMNQRSPLTNELVDAVIEEVLGADAVDGIKADIAFGSDAELFAQRVNENLNLAQRAQIRGTPFTMVVHGGNIDVHRGAIDVGTLARSVSSVRGD